MGFQCHVIPLGIQTPNFGIALRLVKTISFGDKKTRVSPKGVAQGAVEKMFKGKLSSIYGFKNNVMAFGSGLSPFRKLNARIAKKLVSK